MTLDAVGMDAVLDGYHMARRLWNQTFYGMLPYLYFVQLIVIWRGEKQQTEHEYINLNKNSYIQGILSLVITPATHNLYI